MFDLNQLRTTQYDQLQPRRVFTVPAGYQTVDGYRCPEGMEFRFEYAIVNVTTKDAEVHGLGPDGRKLVFRTRAGEHRNIFVFTGKEWSHEVKRTPAAVTAPAPSEGGEAAWLARQPGFERASAILGGKYDSGHWDATRNDADVLRAAAKALAASHPGVARFLADRALSFYHAWMSQATSGGEGTAMQYQVREELKEMRRLAGVTE